MGRKSDKQRHESGESTTSFGDYIPTPPDGGYGWVIMAASFMNHIIVDGIAFTFGVFFDDFLDYFGAGSGQTAIVGSLMSGCYLLSAPLAGALVNKFGCRPVGMAGALIAGFGFFICIFSPNITVMMITYGIIGGVGLGLLYLPNVIAVSYYFQRRRAMATGIAVCGTGVGCFIMAPLGKFLLQAYAWKSAMLVIAAITLNGCLFSALLRPLEPPAKYRRPRSKIFIDRIKERVVSKRSKSSEADGCKPDALTVEKVRNVKMARERALSHEDNDSDMEIDVGPNEQLQNKSVDAPSIAVTVVDADNEQTTDQQTLLCGGAGDSNKPIPSVKFCPMNAGALKRTQLTANNKCLSELCITPVDGKLPPGMKKDDLARPLYRRDIFYSGSVLHIAQFSSQPNIQRQNARSLTSFHGGNYVEPDQQHRLCGCLPISNAAYDTLTQMTDLSLLADPLFLIPCLANLFGAFGLFIPFVYITKRSVELGIPETQAAFLLSVIGVTNTVGRIVAGFIADLPQVNSLLLHNVALLVGGLVCLLNILCVEYISMCVYAAVFGLCIATWISLTSIILCNLLGLERLTNAFGLLTMTRGIATLIGSPLAGFLYDKTLDMNIPFTFGGIMMATGGALCCLLHLPALRRRRGIDVPPPDMDNGLSGLETPTNGNIAMTTSETRESVAGENGAQHNGAEMTEGKPVV